ncbi:hypothetical protein J3A83DRAFT_4039290, partial [Scleroderma citrinum]
HFLTDMFTELLDNTLKKHDLPHLTICWVPDHTNIEGNKSVDKEAKKATKDNSSPMEHLPAPLKKTRNTSCTPVQQSC